MRSEDRCRFTRHFYSLLAFDHLHAISASTNKVQAYKACNPHIVTLEAGRRANFRAGRMVLVAGEFAKMLRQMCGMVGWLRKLIFLANCNGAGESDFALPSGGHSPLNKGEEERLLPLPRRIAPDVRRGGGIGRHSRLRKQGLLVRSDPAVNFCSSGRVHIHNQTVLGGGIAKALHLVATCHCCCDLHIVYSFGQIAHPRWSRGVVRRPEIEIRVAVHRLQAHLEHLAGFKLEAVDAPLVRPHAVDSRKVVDIGSVGQQGHMPAPSAAQACKYFMPEVGCRVQVKFVLVTA